LKRLFPVKRGLNKVRLILAFLTIIVFALKLVAIPHPWPSIPPEQCINEAKVECAFVFDEAHYIRAVRKMMNGDWGVNLEHPPLAKLLIMLGIYLFGDNPWGWRVFPALSGAISIYLLGLIANQLTRDEKISLTAAALYGFDVTCFNLSAIAILEPTTLMFSLLGVLFYLRKKKYLAGLSFGLALLSKLTAAFIIASILFVELVVNLLQTDNYKEALRKWINVLERVGFTAFIFFIAILWIYDYQFNLYQTSFEHLDFMLRYHGEMLHPNPNEGAPPLSWTNPLFPFPKRAYYVTGDKTIAYYGLQTPLWWMTWVVVGYSLYILIMELRSGRIPLTELFILSWFSFTYLVYFYIVLLRPVYPFYFYMTVPAIAIGFPKMLRGERITELILHSILAVQILWFIIYFPVKPLWLATKLQELGLLQ